MAKESMKAREVKRAKLAKRYQHKRDEIAAKVKSGEMDHEEAWQALSKLPRNSNPIRQHNRCKITGRPKGYIRLFGISRIQFREMASKGLIPGVKTASWESRGAARGKSGVERGHRLRSPQPLSRKPPGKPGRKEGSGIRKVKSLCGICRGGTGADRGVRPA